MGPNWHLFTPIIKSIGPAKQLGGRPAVILMMHNPFAVELSIRGSVYCMTQIHQIIKSRSELYPSMTMTAASSIAVVLGTDLHFARCLLDFFLEDDPIVKVFCRL